MKETTAKAAPEVTTRDATSLEAITIRDKLAWLSPQTWWGILQLQDTSSFSAFRMQSLIDGVLGILLPLFVLTILRIAHVCPDRLLPATLVSPWTAACTATIFPQLRAVQRTCSSWRAIRKPLEDDARDTLRQRIQSGRAQRFHRFDVYFPPVYRGQALLFFPGACVPHAAYSEVAALMSDDGLVVVVASIEPVCMPSPGLGADATPMRLIMHQVDSKFLPYPTQWSLGGHSFGAFAAMRLALELGPVCVVLWGVGPFPEAYTNVSQLDCPVLVIQGSNDRLAKHTPESWQEFLKQLPPGAKHKVIHGGTHNGFATYSNNPAVDGLPGITKENQHRLVATATSNFISRHTKC